EGAGAGARQHADGAAALVGGDDVGLTVAVDVPDRHPECVPAGGEVGRGAEGAGAGAQPHADLVADGPVGSDHVGLAVAVEVRDRHGGREPGDGVVGGGGETHRGDPVFERLQTERTTPNV